MWIAHWRANFTLVVKTVFYCSRKFLKHFLFAQHISLSCARTLNARRQLNSLWTKLKASYISMGLQGLRNTFFPYKIYRRFKNSFFGRNQMAQAEGSLINRSTDEEISAATSREVLHLGASRGKPLREKAAGTARGNAAQSGYGISSEAKVAAAAYQLWNRCRRLPEPPAA